MGKVKYNYTKEDAKEFATGDIVFRTKRIPRQVSQGQDFNLGRRQTAY